MNKPTIIFIALLALLISGCRLLRVDDANAASGRKITIVLVGDSTVTDGSGWGLGFKQFVDTNRAVCINEAANGRSSKSYIDEGRWTKALAVKGDYYLIQFGHNDEPGKGPERETDPATTYSQNLARYVDDVRAMGAKPILVTSMTRRIYDASGKLKPSLVPYEEAMKKVAAEKNVPLVDLHDRSVELCQKLGENAVAKFNPIAKGKPDTTHLNTAGRVVFARLVVKELRKAVPELSRVLLAEPRDPMPVVREDKYDVIVGDSASSTYTNLQTAIDAAPTNSTKPFRIFVKKGVYQGQFMVPMGKDHVELFGEDLTNTVLTYDHNQNEMNVGAYPRFRGAGVIVLGNDFHAQNLTFQNASGDHGQAQAFRVEGDRAILNDCRLLGWQDTLLLNNGRDYFTNCYVAGRVDFIYGTAAVVFQNCEIHSRNGGHVTAADTPQNKPFGLVFMDCRLTGDTNPWVGPNGVPANTNSPPKADLGRPWRPYASVTYLNCWMGDHIKPEGWNNWRNPANEQTARFSEYNSSGPGANPDKRFKWAKQLTKEEADKITVSSVLSGTDGWDPGTQLN
ncbi:MAG TPA: pectinesterase family protein [Verrucomicrobiae bacterium]|jgi:pectinesterase